jgi:hypothetical protein
MKTSFFVLAASMILRAAAPVTLANPPNSMVYAVQTDTAGNLYVAGFQGNFNRANPFVAKLSPSGQTLYSTSFAGSNFGIAWAIAVDAKGATYVFGNTNSPDFPVTPGALQTTPQGSSQGFVSKLGAAGKIVYSTFVGGATSVNPGLTSAPGLNSILVDAAGGVIITGQAGTNSSLPQFPPAPGPIVSGSQSFVMKLDPTGGKILGAIGGIGGMIAADVQGNIYVTGLDYGDSVNPLATTPNAFQQKPKNVCGSLGPFFTCGYLGGSPRHEPQNRDCHQNCHQFWPCFGAEASMGAPARKRPGACTAGFEDAGAILKRTHPELIVSKYRMRQVDGISLSRKNREGGTQQLAFSSRPFVLCGLPIRRPPASQLLYERRNGHFVLQLTGHPEFGLPFGQDRLVPILLATMAVQQKSQTVRFRSGGEMLDKFGLAKGGKEYRRLVAAFERIFGATIFFGTHAHGPGRAPNPSGSRNRSELQAPAFSRGLTFRNVSLNAIRVTFQFTTPDGCDVYCTASGDPSLWHGAGSPPLRRSRPHR